MNVVVDPSLRKITTPNLVALPHTVCMHDIVAGKNLSPYDTGCLGRSVHMTTRETVIAGYTNVGPFRYTPDTGPYFFSSVLHHFWLF